MNQNTRMLLGAVVAAALAIAVYYGFIGQQTANNIQGQANQTLGTSPVSQQNGVPATTQQTGNPAASQNAAAPTTSPNAVTPASPAAAPANAPAPGATQAPQR